MGPHPPQTQAWTQTASAQPGRPWLTGLGGGSCDGRRVPHALPQPVQHLARAAGKVEPALQPAGQKRGVGERKEGGGGEGHACLTKPCRSLFIQHLPRAAGRVSPACSQEQHQKGPSWHPLRESVGGARSLRRLQQLGQCAGARPSVTTPQKHTHLHNVAFPQGHAQMLRLFAPCFDLGHLTVHLKH